MTEINISIKEYIFGEMVETSPEKSFSTYDEAIEFLEALKDKKSDKEDNDHY